MIECCKNPRIKYYILFIVPLFLLTLGLLIATLALGVVGIIKAENSNPCSSSDDSGSCLHQASFSSACIINSTTLMVVASDSWKGWLGGATACGVVCAMVASLFLWALLDMIWIIKIIPEMESLLVNRGDISLYGNKKPGKKLNMVGGKQTYEKSEFTLERLGCGSWTALLFSCLCVIISLLVLLWSVAIGIHYTRQLLRTTIPLILVESLMGMVFPSLLFVAAVFMSILLRHITRGVLDGRKAIPHFLPIVKLEQEKTSDYWIIDDILYYELKKMNPQNLKGCLRTLRPNCATLVLVFTIFLHMILAFSLFVDLVMKKHVSVTPCDDSRKDLAYVNCTDNADVGDTHCFKIYRFRVDVVIQSLVAAYALYLATISLFGYIYVVVKILMHLYHNINMWGIFISLVGLSMIVVSSIVTGLWIRGYFLREFNIVNLFHFFVVSTHTILVGCLMYLGELRETQKDDVFGRA